MKLDSQTSLVPTRGVTIPALDQASEPDFHPFCESPSNSSSNKKLNRYTSSSAGLAEGT